MRPPVPEGEAKRKSNVVRENQDDVTRSPVLPSDLFFPADLTRLGSVALKVLYEPSTSMSITDLKAFELSWAIGARKLPAAPALIKINGSALPIPITESPTSQSQCLPARWYIY